MPISYGTNEASARIDVSMEILESYSFQFQARGELPQKLLQASQEMLTGSWLFKFFDSSETVAANSWYLTLSQGQIVFSGDQQFSWQIFLKTLQRYVPRLRSEDVIQDIRLVEQQFLQKQQPLDRWMNGWMN
ncbi:MAG: hypothetical protein HC866_11505 [Leptolyngbyaceae cyanobacterium RU_5_1]|nr:hypothetical protein [Leptolyngbyaceae cyanobacterium RU_5_1]